MSELLKMYLDMMEITFSNGDPVTDEAVLYFPALFDSPEIRINAPRAGEIGARIIELWNATTNDGNERTRASLIQEAIFAALGCTKIDYRSPKQMDEAARQIATFVDDILVRSEISRATQIAAIFGEDVPITSGDRDGK